MEDYSIEGLPVSSDELRLLMLVAFYTVFKAETVGVSLAHLRTETHLRDKIDEPIERFVKAGLVETTSSTVKATKKLCDYFLTEGNPWHYNFAGHPDVIRR
ncbi:hypothetical protein EXS57_01260 [Candidatus Kaiserbacteria bacterium]|nr:hypothetical protein [Candidatus Kaiserbacteria bacterium]